MAQKKILVQPEMQNMLDNMPVKRIGIPENIAAVDDFLQSTNVSFINWNRFLDRWMEDALLLLQIKNL